MLDLKFRKWNAGKGMSDAVCPTKDEVIQKRGFCTFYQVSRFF